MLPMDAAAPPDPALRELAELAAVVCRAPMAFIVLVDDASVSYAAATGFTPQDTRRDQSVAGLLVNRGELTIVPDTATDARCANDPIVGEPARARFIAAAPLIAPGGHAI